MDSMNNCKNSIIKFLQICTKYVTRCLPDEIDLVREFSRALHDVGLFQTATRPSGFSSATRMFLTLKTNPRRNPDRYRPR